MCLYHDWSTNPPPNIPPREIRPYDQSWLTRWFSLCDFYHISEGRSLVEGWLISHDYISLYLGGSKDNGTPKSSILMGFSIINHPFWGIPIFGNTHIWHRIVFAYINSTHVIRISGMIGMIVGCSTSPTSTHTQPKEYHCIYICVFIYVYIYTFTLWWCQIFFIFTPTWLKPPASLYLH